MFRFAFVCVILAISSVAALAEGSPGVVFLDECEGLAPWRSNNAVTLSIDPIERKTGTGSLRADCAVVKSDPGACLLSRRVDLDRVPRYWHFYVMLELDPRYGHENPKLRMIVQDGDGTALVADLDGKSRRPANIDPWAHVTVDRDEFAPLYLGGNGVLDDVATIAFDLPHRAGEFRCDGVYVVRFDELTAVFDEAGAWIRGRCDALAGRLAELEAKLAALPEGVDTAYPGWDAAMIEMFVEHIRADLGEERHVRAARQLRFIEQLADDLAKQIDQAVGGQSPWAKAADVRRTGLTVRDGNFHNGETAVYPGGFCGHWGPEQLRRYASLGLTGLSTEIGPNSTLPEPEKTAVPQSMVELLDLAEELNLAFDLLLSPHYVPAWAFERYGDLDAGELRRKRNAFMPWNVDSEGLRELMSRHLAVVIPAVKDCPALASYDLSNELWYAMFGDFAPADFREFLVGKYGQIERLNAAWDGGFASFEQVEHQAGNPAAAADLYAYHHARVARFYRWYMDELGRHDASRPAYAKIHGGYRHVLGADRTALSRILTASGSDCYPRMGDDGDGLLIDAWSTAIQTQQFRSLSPDKPIVDSEEHSIFYGQIPTGEYVRAVRWWRGVLGLDAWYLWVWGRRTEHNEGTTFSQPWALRALVHAGQELQREAPIVSAFQTAEPDVLLIDDGIGFREAYKLCSFSGHLVDVLPLEALAERAADGYRTVVLPYGADVAAVWLDAAREAGTKIVQLSEDTTLESLGSAITSAVTPAVAPQAGLVNYTVADRDGRTLTFLLNLTPRPIAIDQGDARPAVGDLGPLLPLQPVVLSSR